MVDCQDCGEYLSIEDLVKKSLKCDDDGEVAFRVIINEEPESPPE